MKNDFYYAIVGQHTNTNEGLGRILGVIIAFIIIFGGLFWLIG
ncbi:hypothetical protein [Rhizobium daejeonense]|nr:hypothetical protein [Rhizobium daejeonense]